VGTGAGVGEDYGRGEEKHFGNVQLIQIQPFK